MNERGEITLFFVFAALALSGLLLLSSLQLKKSFRLLETRTKLILCAKETKGELDGYLRRMGQSNWAIKNLKLAQLISMIFPPLATVSGSAKQLKEALIQYQNLELVLHLQTLAKLKKKGCPVDPRMFKTPFLLGATGYMRDQLSVARLRSDEWSYYFLQKPYLLKLSINGRQHNRMKPLLDSRVTESEVMSSFLSLPF